MGRREVGREAERQDKQTSEVSHEGICLNLRSQEAVVEISQGYTARCCHKWRGRY